VTLYGALKDRLLALIPRFGVEQEQRRILACYDLIGRESLALEIRRRAPELSRINSDGTPFQFSLSLAPGRKAALQFLSEAGVPGSSMAERIAISVERIQALGEELDLIPELRSVCALLARVAPAGDRALLANPSGVYWIGLSFPPDHPPALTIYVNAKWGSELDQWKRMGAFAAQFGGTLPDEVRPHMTPLGMSLTLEHGIKASGRVYAAAYGLPVEYYRGLFLANCGPALAPHFDAYVDATLGPDRQYPTRSSVCSLEFNGGGQIGTKFELCAHCAFSSDAMAVARCDAWLRDQGMDSGLYRDTATLLAGARELPEDRRPELHSYSGVGVRRGRPYASIYLNPGPFLECA
jgi:hypothetical protein